MPLYKTKAIIIRGINLGEADKIVTFFTEKFGKVKGVVKGSRKIKSRFCGNIEILTFCNIIYFGKENQNLYRINSCDCIRPFLAIREDLKKLSSCFYILELVDTLLKESCVNKQVFELLFRVLSTIEVSSELYVILRLFEIRLLSLIGFMPEFGRCVICNCSLGKIPVGFSRFKNGIICENCFSREKGSILITQGTLKFLIKLLSIKPERVNRLIIPKEFEQEINMITQRYIKCNTNRELKSYKFMMQMMNEC